MPDTDWRTSFVSYCTKTGFVLRALRYVLLPVAMILHVYLMFTDVSQTAGYFPSVDRVIALEAVMVIVLGVNIWVLKTLTLRRYTEDRKSAKKFMMTYISVLPLILHFLLPELMGEAKARLSGSYDLQTGVLVTFMLCVFGGEALDTCRQCGLDLPDSSPFVLNFDGVRYEPHEPEPEFFSLPPFLETVKEEADEELVSSV